MTGSPLGGLTSALVIDFFFTMVFSTLKPNCHILKFHLFGKGEVDSSYDSFLTVDWWFQEDGFLLVLVKGQIFGSPADVE